MPDIVALILAATATMLATGLGAIPVIFLGKRAQRLGGLLWGLAAGTMGVASITGLLLPALDEGSAGEVAAGLAAGGLFVLLARRLVDADQAHRGGDGRARDSIVVFAVLFVHSLPEGLAIGTAWASTTAGLSAFVVAAIGLQNIPEGTATAIPIKLAGYGAWRQVWAATLTSLPQPVGAVAAYLAVEEITGLLPLSFAFAAGAMLVLVAIQLLPNAFAERPRTGAWAGIAGGAAVMLALGAILGV